MVEALSVTERETFDDLHKEERGFDGALEKVWGDVIDKHFQINPTTENETYVEALSRTTPRGIRSVCQSLLQERTAS